MVFIKAIMNKECNLRLHQLTNDPEKNISFFEMKNNMKFSCNSTKR